jgi:hypothetical protein
MSDRAREVPKPEGKGKGKWLEKGIQAAQQNDIDTLKALVQEFGARLDALEAEGVDVPEEPPVMDGGEEPTV